MRAVSVVVSHDDIRNGVDTEIAQVVEHRAVAEVDACRGPARPDQVRVRRIADPEDVRAESVDGGS